MTRFVLYMSGFVLHMTGFVLNINYCVLNMTGFFLIMTCFVLNFTAFILQMNYPKYDWISPKYDWLFLLWYWEISGLGDCQLGSGEPGFPGLVLTCMGLFTLNKVNGHLVWCADTAPFSNIHKRFLKIFKRNNFFVLFQACQSWTWNIWWEGPPWSCAGDCWTIISLQIFNWGLTNFVGMKVSEYSKIYSTEKGKQSGF